MQVNLSILFQEAFGYKTSAFEPEFKVVPSKDSLDPDVPLRKEYGNTAGAKLYAKDAFGREYYLPVTIEYSDSQSTGVGADTITINKELALPYPVISVHAAKQIVVTALTERGTVKQVINSGDYEITIRGFLIGTTNEMPEDEAAAIDNLYSQKVPVIIKCAWTDIFLKKVGFNAIITNVRWPEVKGVKNVRPYEMTLLSDEPFNLIDIG